MLSVSRKSRQRRLAKLWLAGLGLWGGIVGLPEVGFAQDAYPARLPNAEYTRAVDKIVEREIQQTGMLQTPAPVPEPAPLPPVNASTAPAGSGNYSYTTSCPTDACHQGEFWSANSLFDDGCGGNWLTDNHYNFGGNVAASYTVNTDRPKDHFNGPVTWTDRSNEGQLNQAWLYFEKQLDPDKCFDIGGRIDVMYGSNARFTTETGLEDNINGSHAFYGLAIPQFFLTSKYDKWTFKSGHFISPVGFFTVDTSQNFFNTIPYTYQYGEPFTHTGSLASYQVDDTLNVGAGVIRGWDNFDNTNPHLGVMGTATKTFTDKSSLAYVGIYSTEQNQMLQFKPRYFQTLVYTKSLTEKITYVAQSDFGVQKDAIAGSGKTAFWYGINQYAFYKINDCWSMGINAEWFRDEEGYRVGGFLPNTYAVPGSQVRGLSTSRSGYQGNFYQITMGPKWTPTKNIIVRPNLRFDWFSGGIDKNLNPGKLAPFDNGTKNAQTIFGTDFIVLF
jgi:hypothetical protein